jgi:O-antigen/teichoic acid export membrane protein
MSILRKLLSQTLIYGASTILARLMNLLLTPLYTNLPDRISQSDFGAYINLYAYVAFVNVLLTFGMETTFFRYLQEPGDLRRTYGQTFSWVLMVSALASGLLLLLRRPLAGAMGYAERPELIGTLALVVLLDALAALPLAKLRHEERVRWFSAITLSNVLITISLNLIFILGMGMGIEGIFYANLAASAAKLGMALWRNLPPLLLPTPRAMGEKLEYGFFIMLAGFAGVMNETLDRVMLPYRWGEAAPFDGLMLDGREMNGIYGANYKVAMLIALATQAFRFAAEPFFFRQAGQKDSPETFARVFHYFVLAALAGFLLIGSFALEIEQFNFFGLTKGSFVGSSYWSGVKAVPVLLMAYVFSGAYINLSIWFKITKQTRFALLFTSLGAGVTLIINYFGIPVYGYMASAWATLACYAAMSALVYFTGQRYYPLPYRMGRILLYGLLFLAAYGLNRQIGWSEGDPAVLGMKLLVCILLLGGIVLAERSWPPFGQGQAIS